MVRLPAADAFARSFAACLDRFRRLSGESRLGRSRPEEGAQHGERETGTSTHAIRSDSIRLVDPFVCVSPVCRAGVAWLGVDCSPNRLAAAVRRGTIAPSHRAHSGTVSPASVCAARVSPYSQQRGLRAPLPPLRVSLRTVARREETIVASSSSSLLATDDLISALPVAVTRALGSRGSR